MVRTMLRAALVAAILATLLVPATPAAAATATYTLTTSPVNFTRSNQQYQLTISSTQSGGKDTVSVSISKVSNPAGAAWARQDQNYTWFLVGNRFVPTSTLASATLKTSAEMGDFGNINLTFDDDGTRQTACNRTVRKAPGALTGSVTLNTGTKLFGTIRAVPTSATLMSNTGTACRDGEHSTNACPPAGLDVYGMRPSGGGTLYVYASEAATGPANVSFSVGAPIPDAQTNAPGYMGRSVMAKVPRGDVNIASNLSSATVSGEPGTWISGTATFAANEPAFDPYVDPCAGGKESASTTRPGSMSGNLAANVWIGSDLVVGQNISSYASKTIVRAQ